MGMVFAFGNQGDAIPVPEDLPPFLGVDFCII